MTRHRPDENAVRDRMREHPARTDADQARDAPEAEDAARSDADSAHDVRDEPNSEERSDSGDEVPVAELNGDESDSSAGLEGESLAEGPVTNDEGSSVAQERDEYLALAKRTQADFDNYRKRAAKDLAAAGSRARVGLIREILPVVDNLERALASAANGDEGLVQGVRLVYSDLQGVLSRAGVEAIEPAGAVFDPNVHEALTTREQDGAETGVVLDVVEKGYRAGQTVIRPARVVVAA